MTEIDVRLMGVIQLHVERRPIILVRRQVRVLLAVLALHPGTAVPTDVIMDALWGEALPKNPTHAVHVYVSRFRAVHPAITEVLTTAPGGYVLSIRRSQTDIGRFDEMLDNAQLLCVIREPAKVADVTGQALDLWRGPAFGDLHYEEFVAAEVRRLEERSVVAAEDRCDALIRSGRTNIALPELRALTHQHPYRERLATLTVEALMAEGRHNEAQIQKHTYLQRIKHDFGFDPAPLAVLP
jgi:DNA-binding SARP family transcriptional activator